MADSNFLDRNQELIASQVLPAAGAEVVSNVIITDDARYANLYLAYTPGAAGGAVDFNIEVSTLGTGDTWYRSTTKATNAVTAGADTINEVQREVYSYEAVGVAIEKFVYGPIEIDQTVERIRVTFSETGVVGTPGTIAGHILMS